MTRRAILFIFCAPPFKRIFRAHRGPSPRSSHSLHMSRARLAVLFIGVLQLCISFATAVRPSVAHQVLQAEIASVRRTENVGPVGLEDPVWAPINLLLRFPNLVPLWMAVRIGNRRYTTAGMRIRIRRRMRHPSGHYYSSSLSIVSQPCSHHPWAWKLENWSWTPRCVAWKRSTRQSRYPHIDWPILTLYDRPLPLSCHNMNRSTCYRFEWIGRSIADNHGSGGAKW